MATLDDQHWLPATFRERGLAVPFTSAALGGARVRLVDRRADLVVPHPGGGRGVYIFALTALTEFCAPSLHDQLLADRLASLQALSPSAIRAAARAVAMQGAAGRAAAAAAAAAEQAEARMRTAFQSLLLGRTPDGNATDAAASGIAQETRLAVQQLAERIGNTPEAVKAGIEVLSGHLAEAGLKCSGGGGRCAALLDAMAITARQVRTWMAGAGDHPGGDQVAAAAEAAVAAGQLVLDVAQKPLQDPACLLQAWAAGPEAVLARIGRPALLLDGWEHLCLLWRVAAQEARTATLTEAAVLLPPIPPEAEAWFAALPQLQDRLRLRVAANPAPGSGGRAASEVVAVVERNERIRALAA